MSATTLEFMRKGDRKDAWLFNDMCRGRYGRKRRHVSSRRVLDAMREGDARDGCVMNLLIKYGNPQK